MTRNYSEREEDCAKAAANFFSYRMVTGSLPALIRSTNSAPLRAERLVRLSTEEQNAYGRAGLQTQYEQVDSVIAANGYQLVGTTEIIDVSGTNVTTHSPLFLRLLARVESGEVQVVVVSDISRVARPENLASLAVLDVFARHNCIINAAGTVVDFGNPEGFIAGGVQAIVAGYFRMTTLRRIQAAKEVNRRRGWLTTSSRTLALGISWDKQERKFFYNAEIHRVVEAFRLMDAERLSLSEIGRRVGVHPANVRGVLENEIYATGDKVYREKCDLSVKRVGPGGKQRARPRIARAPDEVIRVKVIERPAVSLERFQRVQEALKEVRLNYSAINTAARQPTLCSVIGRCYCGQPLYVSVNGKRHEDGSKAAGYYLCKTRHAKYAGRMPKCGQPWIARPLLDRLLVTFFKQRLSDVELLSGTISGSLRRGAEVIPFPTAGPEQALEKLKRREQRLVEMCECEVIGIAEFRQRRRELRGQIAALENIPANASATADSAITVRRLCELVVRAVSGFDRADPSAQKAILQSVFSDVFFLQESICAFTFAPSFIADVGRGINVASETIYLEPPFRLREPVPDGYKRCTCCQEPRPVSDFYRKRAQCRDCFNGKLLRKKRVRSAEKASLRGH